MQAPGDHQVHDEAKAALETDDDTLADAAQSVDATPRRRRQRRLDGAHQEGVGDADPV